MDLRIRDETVRALVGFGACSHVLSRDFFGGERAPERAKRAPGGPKTVQADPKALQDRSKIASRRPKKPPRRLQRAPRGRPRGPQEAKFLSIFACLV